MGRLFYNAAGQIVRYPTDRAAAVRLKSVRYDDGEYCPTCDERNAKQPGNRCSIKYTENGRCIHCARMDALHFYNHVALGVPFPELTDITDDIRATMRAFPRNFGESFPTSPAAAMAAGKSAYVRLDPCRRAGHLGVIDAETGECWHCMQERIVRGQSPRVMARKAGETTYPPDAPCPKCGQMAPLRVHDGRCTGCSEKRLRSPRQAAIAAGEKWYTPETPCKRCGSTAPRAVANGQCSGCSGVEPVAEAHDGRSTPDADMMRANPDMVISRADAKLLDMKVFRTGKPCRQGHTGYRYVSTGGCIDCLRGR